MSAGVFALLDGGVVAEVVRVMPGEPPVEERYHPDVAANFVPVPRAQSAQVAPGWRWDGMAFQPPAARVDAGFRYIPAGALRERMEAAGLWVPMAATLAGLLFGGTPEQKALVLKLLTLNEGVRSDDPEARALIAAVGGDPDRLLGA